MRLNLLYSEIITSEMMMEFDFYPKDNIWIYQGFGLSYIDPNPGETEFIINKKSKKVISTKFELIRDIIFSFNEFSSNSGYSINERDNLGSSIIRLIDNQVSCVKLNITSGNITCTDIFTSNLFRDDVKEFLVEFSILEFDGKKIRKKIPDMHYIINIVSSPKYISFEYLTELIKCITNEFPYIEMVWDERTKIPFFGCGE